MSKQETAKHTPGPWTVWEGHAEVYAGVQKNSDGVISGKLLARIANCEPQEELPGVPEDEHEAWEQAFANAHLIAAAPMLLEALKDALEAMNHMGDILNGMDVVTEEDEKIFPAWDKVRAAIKAAEGQQ